MNLRGRSFLTLLDYSPEEIRYLIELSHALKREKLARVFPERLKHRNIVLIFDKTSTRTRCAFEVAALDEGAHVTYLSNSQMGKKESLEDTAKVLGRYYDAIEYRGFGQQIVEDLARYSGVPVWNGLTDTDHPTQILADFMTIEEHATKPLNQIHLCYVGDARNNMGNSLMIGCAKMGMTFTAIAPRALWPEEGLTARMQELAKTTGARISFWTNPTGKPPMKLLKYFGVLLKEFGEFAWHNKAWWIVPVVLVLLLLSVLIFAGSTAAPFIYTLF